MHGSGFSMEGSKRLLEGLKGADKGSQRAQYPLIKGYGLNYIGLHIMI